jgi:pseudaminic acid cytidylyltransferase
MTNRYFCVIPARGGSKRIPKKNIQEVAGIPLIGHVIQNALASEVFERVYVSTDSEEIAHIALKFGAIVPELRDKAISDDKTPTQPVIASFIARQRELQNSDSVVACLYPFAILVSPTLLRVARDKFEKIEDMKKYLVSIQKYSHPIQRALTIDSQGLLSPLDINNLNTRTQDLPSAYFDAGQFYFGKPNVWLEKNTVLANAYGLEIPRHEAVDVDNLDDLTYLRIVNSMRQLREK